MGWALVFSGQGLQHPGMLPWLARDDLMASMESELGVDWRARLATPHDAAHNRRAQVLLTATACAAWAQLRPLVEPPAVVVGYSVGELAAFSAAGVFDARTAVELAGRRADRMDQAAAVAHTGLMGVASPAAGEIDALCARFDLDIAIRIDPRSAILGGLRSDLNDAEIDAAGKGWHCTPLNVAMASHTRWLRPAAEAFEQDLARAVLKAPTLHLISNAQGRVRDAASAGTALACQIAQTVAWDDCMDAMSAHGVHAVLEIGPGHAIARMWQNRRADVPARSADEFRSVFAIAAWLGRQLGRS